MADKNTELVNDDNMEIAWWGYGISGSGDYWANANNIAISFANNDIENGNKVIITKKLNSWDSDGTWDDETFPVYQQSGQRQWGEEYRNCFTVEK